MGIDQYLLVIWSVLSTLTVVKASENLAHGKATNQSSVFEDKSWDSSKAVDGCLSTSVNSHCCAHTAEEQTEAWWQVDLQTQSVIDTVDIIYREDSGFLFRLAGYEIYLSDKSDWTSGTRCHKDDTPDLASMSATQNVQCQGIARYLTIYNDRRVKAKDWYSDQAVLELCEVQVSGCPIGKYGNGNCNNTCFNCLGNICDTSSGICDTCASGYYKAGSICTSCPTNCAGNVCDNLSGACSAGCKPGFTGAFCRCPLNCRDTSCGTDGHCTDCNDGYYGPVCTPCPSGCSTNTCDKISGHCYNCNDGYYGPVCTPCPSGCSGNTCDKTSGHCFDCNDGYYGQICTPCPSGCSGNTCDKTSGHCYECVPGWYGSACDQACSVNCKDKLCHQGNGFCNQCTSGYHGNLCKKNCPSNCKNNSCNKVNGGCIGCEQGYHGSNCSLSCPDNCKDHTCTQSNGQCIECSAGFHGTNCVDRCGYCQDGRCGRDTGICVTSCIEGLTGHKCGVKDDSLPINDDDLTVAVIGIGSGCGVVIVVLIIVIIVLVRRQQTMTHQSTTRSTTMTDISLPGIGQDQRAETDGTYEVIEAETREEKVINKSSRDSSYEQLGERTKDIPHIYDST